MSAIELAVVIGFLTSGLLVGQVGHWLDQLVAHIKGK
jgi:hypothetical protein